MRVWLLAALALGSFACTSASNDATSSESEVVVAPPAELAELRYDAHFVLAKVLERKQLTFDAQKPFPAIRFASQVPLAEFQDAIAPQWGFRPDVITNAYVVSQNTVYLMDDAAYYAQHGRCIDDSLAHELTHYAQVIYQGWVLDGADDSIEFNAIDVQTWFRREHCATR